MNTKTITIVTGVILLAVIGGYAYYNYSAGTITVKMADPPEGWGQASKIYIHFSAIEVHRTDAANQTGWVTVVAKDGWIDLSTVLNVNKTIGQSRLQPGSYNVVRFEIMEAKITIGGTNQTATVVNGKLNVPITSGGVTLVGGQSAEIVLDVSPMVTGSEASGYRFVPAVRAILKS